MFKRKRYPNPICYKTSICRNTISKTDRTILCPSLAQPQSSFIPFHYPYLLPQFPVSGPRDRRSYDDNLNTCCRPFVQTLTPFLYQTVLRRSNPEHNFNNTITVILPLIKSHPKLFSDTHHSWSMAGLGCCHAT